MRAQGVYFQLYNSQFAGVAHLRLPAGGRNVASRG